MSAGDCHQWLKLRASRVWMMTVRMKYRRLAVEAESRNMVAGARQRDMWHEENESW